MVDVERSRVVASAGTTAVGEGSTVFEMVFERVVTNGVLVAGFASVGFVGTGFAPEV